MEGGNTSRIVVWLDDTVIIKKPLADKTYYFVADARTGQPVPRADVELFGWRHGASGRQERVPRRDQDARRSRPTTRASSGADRRAERAEQAILPMAHHRERRRRADSLTWASRTSGPSRPARPRLRPDQGLHDHRPAGLSSRHAGAVQVLGRARPLRSAGGLGIRRQDLHRRDPESQGGQGLHQGLHGRRVRRLRRLVRAAVRRDAGGLSGLHSQPRRRLVPGRGVQEARVRGERRGPDRAGDARREGVGDHQGEVLFRRAGRRGEGQVQDHPHDGRRAVVSRRSLGLAVRPGLLVVRRRFVVVSRLVALGHAPARRLVVGHARSASRSGGRGRAADPARRNAGRRDRHRAGQGGPSRPGPAVRDHGRDHRPVAPHDRGDGHRAGRPQAVHRLYLGRSRPLPRGRHDRGGAPRQTLDHKPVAGKGTLKLLKIAYDAEQPAGRDTRGELGPDSRRRGSGPPGDQGVGRRPVPAGGDDRRRQGPRDRGRLPAHDHRARVRRCELPLQRPRDHPRAEGIPARRDAPALDQHQPGQFDGPALRPADERRVPAAQGRPPAAARARSRRSASFPATCPTSSSRP